MQDVQEPPGDLDNSVVETLAQCLLVAVKGEQFRQVHDHLVDGILAKAGSVLDLAQHELELRTEPHPAKGDVIAHAVAVNEDIDAVEAAVVRTVNDASEQVIVGWCVRLEVVLGEEVRLLLRSIQPVAFRPRVIDPLAEQDHIIRSHATPRKHLDCDLVT